MLEQLEVGTPLTEEEKTAILLQLERLLLNSHFHKSKRFPIFLRFVVTETLAGRADQLKERTLGIEVFGKDPNYDTTDDPIVRVTAGEIRKRIAQYYQEPGHEHEIKLLLPPGSYVPQFCFPDAAANIVPSDLKSIPTPVAVPQPLVLASAKYADCLGGEVCSCSPLTVANSRLDPSVAGTPCHGHSRILGTVRKIG